MSAWTLPTHCPPDGHWEAAGEYFRLTQAGLQVDDVPPDSDWQLPIDKKRSEAYEQVERCDAYAHSLFADLAVLERAKEALGWARKKSISRVTLSAGTGTIIESPSNVGDGHHDWWPEPLDHIPSSVVMIGKEAQP